MKSLFKNKYKILNTGLLGILLTGTMYMHLNYESWFKDAEIKFIYDYYDAIYAPLFVAGKWLAIILAVLLFFPTDIFKKWLFYIAPPILLLTLYLVQGISVYSGNLLNPTRAKMAENGMFVLAIVTAAFVLVHLYLDWKKRKNIKTL